MAKTISHSQAFNHLCGFTQEEIERLLQHSITQGWLPQDSFAQAKQLLFD